MTRGSWSRCKPAISRKISAGRSFLIQGITKDYVGTYKWRPDGETDVVALKNGKLSTLLDGDEDEYLPLGSDTFFIANDLGSVRFTRDASGRVTGYT
jgi:hypothetical protein